MPAVQQQMPQAMPAAQPMPVPNMQKAPINSVEANYLSKTMPIFSAIIAENPNYQQHVGSCIFPFVQNICGADYAPKITGMLIDLPIYEIHLYMKDYGLLQERVLQAKELLDQQARQQ